MNAQKAEKLIIFVYGLDKLTSQSHDQYLGGLKTLRELAKTDTTIEGKMFKEGLL